MKISTIGETVTIENRDFTVGQKMLIKVKGKEQRASLVEVELEEKRIANIICQIDETLECVNVIAEDILPDIEIDFMIRTSNGSNEIVELNTKLKEELIQVIQEECMEALEEDIQEAIKDQADLYVRIYLPYEGGEKDWTELSILEEE